MPTSLAGLFSTSAGNSIRNGGSHVTVEGDGKISVSGPVESANFTAAVTSGDYVIDFDKSDLITINLTGDMTIKDLTDHISGNKTVYFVQGGSGDHAVSFDPQHHVSEGQGVATGVGAVTVCTVANNGDANYEWLFTPSAR